jgi:hypothetical protein
MRLDTTNTNARGKDTTILVRRQERFATMVTRHNAKYGLVTS